MPKLRMNQGDPSEARVYFIPHFVARALGFFASEGVDVEFIWSPPGDHMAKSGQIPAVLDGSADFTVGGPMVTMRMQSEGSARLVNFCAVIRANPWYLVARARNPGFAWSDLVGKTVLDVANITTASLCLRWLLMQHGIENDVTVVAGSGDEQGDLQAVIAGRYDYAIHSLHALGPLIADGRIATIADLAKPTGNVPWSAYIALPATIEAKRPAFAAFVKAIAAALAWINDHSAEEAAALVARDFPGYPAAGLTEAIRLYKATDMWPRGALIPQADFEHFQDILIDVGWFTSRVAYEDQVITDLAAAASAR